MAKVDVFVSVVAVLRPQADGLYAFVDEVHRLLDVHYTNFEILLLENGPRGRAAGAIKALLGKYKCLRHLRLSREMDNELAVLAGLDAAIGDFVVILDPDFDPPEEMLAMVEQCRAGSDVVLGVEEPYQPAGLIYRSLRKVFFILARWLVGVDMIPRTTGYRVLSRHAVNALTRVRQRRRCFPLVTSDIGFEAATHPHRRISRLARTPRSYLLRDVRRGLSMIVHNSITPLRFVSVLGLLGSLLSLAYSIYVVVVYLLKRDIMPGWTTLSLQTSGLFFLVFVMLTLIGEYLGRTLEELSDRPLYHIREEQSSAVPLADLTRRNVLAASEQESPTMPLEKQ
jgi:glycosyltransferase involved in cell wall biosynthesis